MQLNRVCLVRSIAFGPRRTGLWLLALGGCLSLASFAVGFAVSRYGIDLELADSSRVLNRSARAYEAEQTLLFAQWAESYVRLRRRIAVIPKRREVAQHGR